MFEDESKQVDKLFENGQVSEASQIAERLVTQFPSEPKAWNLLADMLVQRGDKSRAVESRSKAIEICNCEPHYIYMRGIDLFGLERYREAAADFTRVIELCDLYKSDYYRAAAYFFRADAYVRLGQFDLALYDCNHVPDGMSTWTDAVRTKSDILADCRNSEGHR